jgi:outer membrane protein assembly factor BamA
VPYGNSDVLPYIKQFFIGGSNSIRAFRARTLGPGTYPPPPPDSVGFFDQSGDIKLEMNAEYRFNLISVLKGAVFADAGNIWLIHDDPVGRAASFMHQLFLASLL